jgi:carboxyl-terminal processing protease
LGQFESGHIAVLTDEGTASASEILAGAIQDWERGVIIGRRTFGKGLVQEQFDLSDHSALRLTVARYYTPLGRSIQRSYSNGGKAYYEEISNRYTDGEYLHEDASKNDTTKKFKTLKGKILYGGGGISPDYFISGDTGRMGEFSTKVFMSGLVSSYGYRLLLQDPSMASHYSSPEDFAKNFSLSTNNWNFFLQMAAKDSINITNISPAEKEYLTTSLKRSVARQLWHNEGYYRMLNADDKAVKKALEILEK